MVNKYKKKPVVIEAAQFTGGNYDEIADFFGNKNIGKIWSGVEVLPGAGVAIRSCLYIKTLEGEMKASVGDFIIKGVNGEFYPCKPDIFYKTYEEV